MTPFGTTADGRAVDQIALASGDLTVNLLTLGAIVQDVRLAGVAHSLTLGSDRLADYESTMRYHGALIGPVVNRLAGAQAVIAGKTHHFEANQGNDIMLHSGAAGTQFKIWQIADHGPTHATLTLDLTAGEGGFPGNRHVTARFTVSPPATLSLDLTVTTDAPTIVNFANHSYWNLDGTDCWNGHSLRIAADHALPTDDDFVATGEIAAVADTPLDFREARTIRVGAPLLDNNWCLSDAPQPLRDVLWLRGQSGVMLTLATTCPGVQVYDGRAAIRPGKTHHEGLAIEAQDWPNAPAHPTFPSITLNPGDTYARQTVWRFSR